MAAAKAYRNDTHRGVRQTRPSVCVALERMATSVGRLGERATDKVGHRQSVLTLKRAITTAAVERSAEVDYRRSNVPGTPETTVTLH
uniref:Uncharacterized protein n=1 Tax=Knipowitschia caucasica TaxID=637954 RepID=A0AAV2JI47_KNICA